MVLGCRLRADRCSLGFNAVVSKPGEPKDTVLVTNSHCTDRFGDGPDGSRIYQPLSGTSSDFLGLELKDKPLFQCGPTYPECRYSDAALIEYADASDWQIGTIARTTGLGSTTIDDVNFQFFITAEMAEPPYYGQVLDRVGRTSGWASGAVNSTCQDITNTLGIRLLCQDATDAEHDVGDSGGPVFQRTGSSTVTLYGIHWGGDQTFAVFSTLSEIQIEDFYGNLKTF